MKRYSPFLVVLAAFFFGLGTYLIGSIQKGGEFKVVNFASFFCLFSLITGFICVTFHSLFSNRQFSNLTSAIKDNFLTFIFLGPIGTGLAYYFVVDGMSSYSDNEVKAATAGILLQFDLVSCVIIGIYFLREKITSWQWIGIIISFIGATIMLYNGKTNSGSNGSFLDLNVLKVLTGALLFGVSIACVRIYSIPAKLHALQITWLRLFGAIIMILFILFIEHFIVYPNESFLNNLMIFQKSIVIRPNMLLEFLVLSVTNFYIGFWFISIATKKMASWKVAAILRLIPFFTILVELILRGPEEVLDQLWKYGIGTVLVFTGIFLIDLHRIKMLKKK